MTAKKETQPVPTPFQRALPKGLKAGKDKLLMSIHIYEESIVLQDIQRKEGSFRMVSARDLAHTLASGLSFDSGLLPENALWWGNSKGGVVVAVWVPPGVRRLAVQSSLDKTERYAVPLPGLIFICRSGRAPWVYAAARRPSAPKDKVFHAPLPNVHDTGDTCGGSVRFPREVEKIPEVFLTSFFTRHLITGASKSCPGDVVKLWKRLDGKKEFPLSDLEPCGTVGELLQRRYA